MQQINKNSYPLQPEQAAIQNAILANVNFEQKIDLGNLSFHTGLGGLVLPETDDTMRMLVFRGHQPTEQTIGGIATNQLLNRGPERAHQGNSILGLGMYVGNTAEAVAIFATQQSGREIGVYLTPPFKNEDVKRSIETRAEEKPWRYMMQVGLMGLKDRTRSFSRFVESKERQYGDAKLVVHDVDMGTSLTHKAQLEKHEHSIMPKWYVWRDHDTTFERIGTVQKLLKTNSLVKVSRGVVKAARMVKPRKTS